MMNANNSMYIAFPQFEESSGKFKIYSDVKIFGETERLWFETEQTYKSLINNDSSDSFLVAALVRAMTTPNIEEIHVEGVISEKLYYNITSYLINILKQIIPNAKDVRIVAPRLTSRHYEPEGVITGFSAGVDSFSTIVDHIKGNASSSYELTHLLFNNVGSHGQTVKDMEIFYTRHARLKEYAEAMNLPLIPMNSNLDRFLRLDFMRTHTIRNAAVALLFQKSCKGFLYASSVPYNEASIKGSNKGLSMSYTDPLILPLLSTESIDCISSGGQYTRFEKTENISNNKITYDSLDVCAAPQNAKKINCSKCKKCLRTQASLEIINSLELYDSVFERNIYKKFKTLYIAYALGSSSVLEKEIVQAFKYYNYDIPKQSIIMSKLIPHMLINTYLRQWGWANTDNPVRIGWRTFKYLCNRKA